MTVPEAEKKLKKLGFDPKESFRRRSKEDQGEIRAALLILARAGVTFKKPLKMAKPETGESNG